MKQTSNKVAASLDPQLQKQYDLDNLELSNYRIKYGIGSDVIVEYVKNSMAKNSIKRAKREKQALADSQDTVDVIRDTGLGLLATGVNIIGGTTATGMAIAADPEESAIAIADGSVKLGAAFTGTLEEYEKNKAEAKANVNQFLEETGIGADVAKPLPEKLESENAPSLSEDFMEVLTNIGQNKYGKDLLRGGSDMVFRGTKAVSDWIRSGQSDAYKAANEIRAEENEEFKTKIKATLGEDSTVYENMAANTQIGFNAFANLMKDPSSATVVTIESVPYMLAAGNLSKSISNTKFDLAFNREKAKITEAVNKENLSHFNTQELIKVKLGNVAGDLLKKKDADQDTITAISAGVLEGSGAANEAYNIIVSTDFDVLAGTSEAYNKYLETMDKYEARKALASESALSAGLSVFAIA
ncbi:MAG: hypothetical protein GY810_21950, partial [Aureispira sp.]|nr:hypothetical protein [Aureispira sp.]